MKYEFKRHRPEIPMREDQIDLIVEGFGKTFTPRRAAGWAMISYYHLTKWLKRGQDDHDEGKDTLYAQLFLKVARRLSEKANDILSRLETAPNNSGALTWILEKCLKQDYGSESEEYKELVDLYGKLFDSYKRLADNSSIAQGVQSHGSEEVGQEMDTERD